ncbi:MAG: hypothetical protein ACFCGT_25575, partial [Sandaracinaceae bacterium]
MSESIGREEVLAVLSSRAPRAMHLMEVVQRLGVDKARRDDVLDVLEELSGRGLGTQMPGQRFRLGARRAARGPAPPDRSRSGADADRP